MIIVLYHLAPVLERLSLMALYSQATPAPSAPMLAGLESSPYHYIIIIIIIQQIFISPIMVHLCSGLDWLLPRLSRQPSWPPSTAAITSARAAPDTWG